MGRELVAGLSQSSTHEVIAVSRRPLPRLAAGCEQLLISDLSDPAACEQIASRAKDGGTLLHLAALTPGTKHSDADFERVNAAATGHLMRAAIAAGVPRFIYLSSTHACGALSGSHPIDEDSPVDETSGDAYGASKLAGEVAVKSLGQGTGTHWTIVRAPLVYGPGAKGSLALLARAIMRGIPLPLASLTGNARDMIGVRNLSTFLQLCVSHARAANETFVVRDGDPISTRRLTEDIALAAGIQARLVPCPAALLKLAGRAVGAAPMVERLLGDHRVNDAKARKLLGWRAPAPMTFDLQRMVAHLKQIETRDRVRGQQKS